MAAVTVEIGSAGNEQAQLACYRAILRFRLRIVIRVAGFERIEAGGGEWRDQGVAFHQRRMRERRNAAGLVNGADDRGRRGAAARNESRSTEFEVAIERLVARRDVTFLDQRERVFRAPDAASARGIGEDRIDVDRRAERGEPRAHLAHAAQPILTLTIEEGAQRR